MGENSSIEWTDHTFNPWVGCTKVGPGCDHCYAEGWAKRSGLVTWGADRRRTSPANWRKPLRWNAEAAVDLLRNPQRPRPRVFCASLADVFDNEVDPEWRRDLFSMIAKTKNLDWLLLTKRIGNAAKMLDDISVTTPALDPQWWPNVWLGITVVNQEEADRDIPKLLSIPAAVRFLSCEPLISHILLDPDWLCSEYFTHSEDCENDLCALNGDYHSCAGKVVNQPSIDWVIVGGESGPHARPMEADWAEKIRVDCQDAGIAFFMKQGSQANWRDFKDWDQFPGYLQVREFPQSSALSITESQL